MAPTLAFTVGTATPGLVPRDGIPNNDDGNSPTTDDLSRVAPTDDGASGGSSTVYESPFPTLAPVLPAGVLGKPSFQPTGTFFEKTQPPVQQAVYTSSPTPAGYTLPPTSSGYTYPPTQGYVLPPQSPTDDTLNQLLGIGSTPASNPVASPTAEIATLTGTTRHRGMTTTSGNDATVELSSSSSSLSSSSSSSTMQEQGIIIIEESISDMEDAEAVVTVAAAAAQEEEEVEEEEEEDEGFFADSRWEDVPGDRYIRIFDEGHEEMPENFRLGQYNEKGVYVEYAEGERERAPYESDEVTLTGDIINTAGHTPYFSRYDTQSALVPTVSSISLSSTLLSNTLLTHVSLIAQLVCVVGGCRSPYRCTTDQRVCAHSTPGKGIDLIHPHTPSRHIFSTPPLTSLSTHILSYSLPYILSSHTSTHLPSRTSSRTGLRWICLTHKPFAQGCPHSCSSTRLSMVHRDGLHHCPISPANDRATSLHQHHIPHVLAVCYVADGGRTVIGIFALLFTGKAGGCVEYGHVSRAFDFCLDGCS